MYKLRLILFLFLSSIVLIGCGSDSSPSSSILNQIETQKLSSSEDIKNVIQTYYKDSLNQINSSNCLNPVKTDNVFQSSVNSFSKKYCSNISAFQEEFKKVLSKINETKNTSFTFDMITGRSEFIQAGFSGQAIDIFFKNNISLIDAKQIRNISNNYSEIEKIYFRHKIKKPSLINKWVRLRIPNNKLLSYLEIGVDINKPDETKRLFNYNISSTIIKEWQSMGYSIYDILFLRQKYLKVSNKDIIQFIKKHKTKLNKETLLQLSEIDMTSLRNLKKFIELNLSVSVFKAYYDVGVRNPTAISFFNKSKISAIDVKKYYKRDTWEIIPLDTIKNLLSLNVSPEFFKDIDYILPISRDLNNYSSYKKIIKVDDKTFITLFKHKRLKMKDIEEFKKLNSIFNDNKTFSYYATLFDNNNFTSFIPKFFKTTSDFKKFYSNNKYYFIRNSNYLSQVFKYSKNLKELNLNLKTINQYCKYELNEIIQLLSLDLTAEEINTLFSKNFRPGTALSKTVRNFNNISQSKISFLIKEALSKNILKVDKINSYIKERLKNA